jgi:hypothetical protein
MRSRKKTRHTVCKHVESHDVEVEKTDRLIIHPIQIKEFGIYD